MAPLPCVTRHSFLAPSPFLIPQRQFSTFQIKFNKNENVTELDCLKSKLEPFKNPYPSSTATDDVAETAALTAVQAHAPECFYPQYQTVKEEGKIAKANNYNVRHSVYKLVIAAKAIQGMHLYDAQEFCANAPTKAADVMSKLLNSARRNAKA